jgi:YD repeat-containing protein
MKKSFSVLLVVTILCTMLPVSLLAPNNVNAAIVEVPRIADYDAPQDSQPFQTYPIPINDEGNEVWNTYPIDEWYVDDDPVSFFSPDVTEFVPERIEFERVYEAGLRVNINPSIYMPGATISVSWELENFTSGFDNHSYYLQFYSNDLSELPGSTRFDNELSSLSIEELSGNFQLHKTNTDEANELSFNLSLYRDGELLDVQQVVLPVADNNTESANLYGNLNGQVQIENFNLSNGLENLIFSANRPSPHKTPSYSLQGMMLEILAVDPINNVDINSFIEPVKITIPYNSELFSDEQEADLQLYYFNEADNEWYPMATTVDTETKTLSVFTDHLTVFDYKASNWQAYLPPLLQSYEVSEFTGAANYTYQIPTIAAEGGIRPELALRYNSQIIDEGAYFTQASWVGMGWSLDTGAITRDMHETPSSLNDDTFFLNLNGISGRLLPVSTTGEYTEYRLQQDSSHRIRQYGDQSWVVFGNNGVNYHFENQQSSNAYYAANSCADLQIWKWMLTRIVDANGNTIIYENEKGQKTYEKNSATCTIDHSIYPKSIKYSPVSGGGYKYQINFVTDTRVDYKESWNENSSATFFDKVKLNKVELLINNQPYRDYLLTYSNLILPAINWNGADTPTLALAVIKEVGHYGSQSLYTPALSFEYKDKLHLSKIDNNQGGKVEFGYTPHEEYIDSHKGPRSVQWDRLTGCQYLGSHPWLHRHRENGVLCQDENLDDGTMYELTFLPAPSEPSPKDSALLTASIPETMLKYGGKYRFAFIGRSVSDNGTGTDLGFKCKMPRKLDVINFYVGTNSTSMGFTLELDTEWDITTTDFYTESTGLRISLLEIVLYPGRYVVTSRTETDYSDSNNPNSVTWDYEYEGFAYNNPQNSPSSDADKLYVPHYREFRGFSKATQTLQGENLKIISYFDQRDRTKGNLLKREVILNNMLYQTSTYEYQTHDSIVLINNDALAKASLRQFIDLDIYWNRLVSEKHTIHPNGNVNNLYGTETRFSYNGCAYNDPACENNMARDDFKAQLTRKASYVFKTSGNPEPFLIDFINYQTPGFFNVSEHSNAPTGRQHWHSTRVDSIEARKVDATTLLRKTLYFYDNQGNLITQRVLQDGGNYAQTSYSYNDTGDLVTERSWKEPSSFNSDPQGAAIVVGYSYDPAFPGQVYQQTIGAGSQNQLTTTTFYDLRNNLPIKVQHPNGAIEGAAYDPLGRIIKICAQDNWNPEVQTCADVERPTLGVTYRNYHRETNQPMSILLDPFDGSDIHHYYNGFGKLIQTQTRHAHLSASETTNFVSYAARYDGLGRLIYESNAFDIGAHGYSYYHLDFPSMPDGVRQYSYDPLGRLLSIQRISSASSPRLEKKFDYQFFADSQRNEWLSVSIESDARDQAGGWQYATKTRTNALGQVVNVIPPTGPSTRFVYDALGQLLEAYYGNAKTTMTYDYAGNKISMKDPDMGYWVYGYNYNGSLSVQIDGNNQKTCLSYDSINRLISKSFGNHPSSCDSLSPSIQYRYDENGQLGYRTGMTDASGTTAWKYDLRGRMIREDKTVGSFGAFTTQWAYDSADRVIAMLYPDGERVDFSYLPQGGVNRVGAYLTGTQVNANGQISLRTFGNGTQTSLTYHDWLTNGGRLSALQSGQSASLLNLGFTYDSVGNILTITDGLNSNQVQSFTYDALNRLTAASTNGVGQGLYAQNYGYDPATGNLASKSDVGAYSYSPAKPHAVA